ncbi:methyltransferase, FxLD system [Kribbella sp. NPDC051587]|uniref:methyltransferase, FxLD system n=1 Tax=Kribbella sp. NPDC051587 TaxID=3364119 RepID=UPI0037B31273
MNDDRAAQATDVQLRRALVDEIAAEGWLRTPAIKAAMEMLPRHLFVPGASVEQAYANTTVDIKHADDGLAISCASQPTVVAMMLEQLQVEPGHNVLELGAGTGYNAGLLGKLVGPTGRVTTVDVDDDLVTGARSHLAAAGLGNVSVVLGDGALGHPADAPYDRIVATVGAHGVPRAWLDQLAPGGRLVVPQRIRGSVSRSFSYENRSGTWVSIGSQMNSFMPLRDGVAADDRDFIPIAADGSVRLQTYSTQPVDAAALADVIDQPRSIAWTDVLFRGKESPEWMELWLTCSFSSGLNRMTSNDEAARLLVDDPYPSSAAVVENGTLAYLVRRLSRHRTPEGDKLWEFGVVGHGPAGDDLAQRVRESMRTWNRDYRGREVSFELRIHAHSTTAPYEDRFVVEAPPGQLLIDWH